MGYLLLAILFQSASIIFMKYASLNIDKITLGTILSNKFYLISLMFLILQALVWQFVLQRMALSKAYYCMSGVYVTVFFSSFLIFRENVRLTNILGILIIITGITILTRSASNE